MLRTAAGLLAFGCLLGGLPARADHLAIDLTARSGKASQTAHAEKVALGVKTKPRGVLEVKAGTPVSVKWTMRNQDAKVTLPNVLVHSFVVKEEKAGQLTVPKLDRNVIAETALTMDFRPSDKNEGELQFTIDKPGVYLLRLETIGAAVGAEGHEHFAALDLVVK